MKIALITINKVENKIISTRTLKDTVETGGIESRIKWLLVNM